MPRRCRCPAPAEHPRGSAPAREAPPTARDEATNQGRRRASRPAEGGPEVRLQRRRQALATPPSPRHGPPHSDSFQKFGGRDAVAEVDGGVTDSFGASRRSSVGIGFGGGARRVGRRCLSTGCTGPVGGCCVAEQALRPQQEERDDVFARGLPTRTGALVRGPHEVDADLVGLLGAALTRAPQQCFVAAGARPRTGLGELAPGRRRSGVRCDGEHPFLSSRHDPGQ